MTVPNSMHASHASTTPTFFLAMALSKEERNRRNAESQQRRRARLKEEKEAEDAAVEAKRDRTNANNRASYARRQQKRKNEQAMATPRNSTGQQHHPAAATMTPRTPFPGVETPAGGYPSYSTSTVRVARHMTPKQQFATMRVEALASIAKSNHSMAESQQTTAEAQRTMAESQCTMAESNLIVAKELEALQWEEEEESQDDSMSPMRNFVEPLDSLDSESPPPESSQDNNMSPSVRNLAETLDSFHIQSPPPDDTLPHGAPLPVNLAPNEAPVVAAVRTVTPEPAFILDKWSFKSQEDFASVVPQFVSQLQVLERGAAPVECTKLCLRFLSFLLVEHETYFDSLFTNPNCTNGAHYLFAGLEVKTGIQVKHGVNVYIDDFQKGSQVKYRSLDGQGNLIGLVDVEIVAVDSSVRGAFTIKTQEGKEISTMIDRLEPTNLLSHDALFGQLVE